MDYYDKDYDTTFNIQILPIQLVAPYKVKMTLSDGTCQKIDSTTISMYDTVGMSFTVDNSPNVIWDSLASTIIGSNGNMFEVTLPYGYFLNYLQDTNTYYYPGQQIDIDYFSDHTSDSIYTEYIQQNISELYGIGISWNGCVEMDTLFIVNRQPIPDTIYNVFTPNGDGVNDYWEIPYADQYPDIEVQIFNRWGQLVYHRKGYGDASEAMWDGKSMKNNKDLPMGTYLYVIMPNDGESKTLTGTVTIIR